MLYLKNLEEFNFVKNTQSQLLNEDIVLTTNFELWLVLKQKGYSIRFRSEYLAVEDYQYIKNEASSLSHNWYKPIKEKLVYKKINLAETWRIQSTVFFREVVSANLIMRKIIEKEKPSQIVVIGTPRVLCQDKTRFNGENDVFKEVAIKFATKHEIPIHILKENIEKKSHELKSFLLKSVLSHYFYLILRKVLLDFRNIGNKNEVKNKLTREGTDSIPIAYSLAYSYDAEILNQVHSVLNKSGKYKTVLISENNKFQIISRSGLDRQKIQYVPLRHFTNLDYYKLNEAHNFVFKAKKAWLNYRVDIDQRFEYFFPELQLNFYFDKYLLNAVLQVETGKKILKKLKPHLFITDDFGSSTQKLLCNLAKNEDICTVGIPHGCINDIEEYEFFTDVFLAWGSISKKQLIKEFDSKENSIKEVGSLTLNKVKKELIVLNNKFSSGSQNSRMILILTGTFTSEVFGKSNVDEYLAAWNELKEFINTHNEIQFIIKTHPYHDYFDWYSLFVEQNGLSNVQVIKNASLEELIVSAQMVVLFQVISTAALIAMMAMKPVLFINNATKTYTDDPSNDWNFENGLTVISEVSEIKSILQKTMIDEGFRQSIIEHEQRFLEKYVTSLDDKVEEKILNAVEQTFKVNL